MGPCQGPNCSSTYRSSYDSYAACRKKEINNQGSSDQSVAMSISETVSETMSFSHSAGVSVTVGTEFSVGIPFLAEGKVSTEISTSYDFSYGKTICVSVYNGSHSKVDYQFHQVHTCCVPKRLSSTIYRQLRCFYVKSNTTVVILRPF